MLWRRPRVVGAALRIIGVNRGSPLLQEEETNGVNQGSPASAGTAPVLGSWSHVEEAVRISKRYRIFRYRGT